MEEGGQPARLARYEANAKELLSGMAELGFTTYLSPEQQGCIISTFRESLTPNFQHSASCYRVKGGIPTVTAHIATKIAVANACLLRDLVQNRLWLPLPYTGSALAVVPDDPAWNFDAFYEGLEARGAVIYPGKLTDAECFRLGSIGELTAFICIYTVRASP